MFSKITNYFKDTRAELKHVVWPSRKETIYYTVLVLVISVLLAYYSGFFDFVFSKILLKILPN